MGYYFVKTEFVDTYGVFHHAQKKVLVSYYETLPEHDQKNFHVYGKEKPWQYVVGETHHLPIPEYNQKKKEPEKPKVKKKEEPLFPDFYQSVLGASNPFSGGGSFGGGSFGGGGAGSDW